MTRTPTPRFAIYALMSLTGLTLGLALGRPELVVVAAPATVALAVSLALPLRHEVAVDVALERSRAFEGERLALDLRLRSRRSILRYVLRPSLPPGLALAGAESASPASLLEDTVALRLPAGEERTVRLLLECNWWGGYRLLDASLSAHDLLGLFEYAGRLEARLRLSVFPPPAATRRLLRPLETQLNVGELVARRAGDGIEFAEVRPLAPGDDPRRLNWRVMARRGGQWVNARHPDRNSDVVLVVDTSTDSRRPQFHTIDLAVRAAATLAAGHLGRRDRVGLVVLGGTLQWLSPRMLDAQRYRILEALIDSRSRAGGVATAFDLVPPRALPPQALVIGLSPLLDEGAVRAFADLRGRGYDLALIEVEAERYLAEPEGLASMLARRVWRLERDATRRRFQRHGVAVARWEPHQPFTRPLMEVTAFRRSQTRAGA